MANNFELDKPIVFAADDAVRIVRLASAPDGMGHAHYRVMLAHYRVMLAWGSSDGALCVGITGDGFAALEDCAELFAWLAHVGDAAGPDDVTEFLINAGFVWYRSFVESRGNV